MEALIYRENTRKKTSNRFAPMSSIRLLTLLFLLVSPSFTYAQFLLCDGAKGPNLFTNYNNGTFGKGVPQNKGPLGSATTYTYIPISCNTPSDGYYSVSNSTDCGSGGKVFGTWDVIGDHTGAANPIAGNPPPAPGTSAGYMLVVNASVGKDVAVVDSIRNLCPNQTYEFQAWIRSLNPPGILPNLMFMINGVDTYPTGNITDKQWKNIGFTFPVPVGKTAIKVSIRNNAPGGDGNDWVLDDISVSTCNTKIKISADTVINVCEGATINLKDTVLSTTGTPFPYYKWQKSVNNGSTWTDLTGVITETGNPKNYVASFAPFVATLSMTNTLFRLVVATDADVLIKNDICYYSAVKTTRLIVNPNPVLKIASAAICAGDTVKLTVSGADIFNWTPPATLSKDTGKTVNAFPITTTVYTITAKTFAGCPATTTVTVTVKPIVADAGPDTTICFGSSIQLHASGGTKYFWNPKKWLNDSTIANPIANPTSTITYTVTVTSGSCIDQDEVTITVIPPIVLKMSAFPPKCFNGNDGKAIVAASGGTGTYTYQWIPAAGSSASVNGPPGKYSVLVTDKFGCMDTASVIIPNTKPISGLISTKTSNCNKPDGAATVDTVWGGASPYTYSWNTSPVQNTQTASNITSGSYNVVITDANGCTATLTAIVPNTPGISVSATTTNVSCFGGTDGTATATGSAGVAPYAYVWSNNQNTDVAKTLVAGTYTVIVTDARGCPAITTVTITQPTKVMITSIDTSICPLAIATLHAKGEGGTGSIVFSWNPGGATGNTIAVNPVNTTTYTITGTDQKGCKDSTTVTVKLNAIPVITSLGDTICLGKSTTLKASGASTYTWSPTTGLNSGTGNQVIASPVNTITYTITGTDSNNCVGTRTIVVDVKPAPVITTTSDNACPNDTMTLTANGAVTYVWSPARGLNTTNGPVVIANPDQTTTYTVTGTSANRCTSTATATATINPEPVAAIIANPNPALVFYPTIHFTDNTVGGPIKWNWSFGDAKKTTSIKQHPSFTYPDTIGSYKVRLAVVNQFGCVDTTWIIVDIRGQYSFYIPNTFTPNADGINDGFAPKGTGIDESDFGFWIFDRWGDLIWKSNTWGEHWNGKANKGEDIAQIDTYVWKVRVKELDTHVVHTYIGHVNIVK